MQLSLNFPPSIERVIQAHGKFSQVAGGTWPVRTQQQSIYKGEDWLARVTMEDGYFDGLFSGSGDNTSPSNTSWDCVNLTRLKMQYAEAASATVVSSVLSVFGSFLIILTYVMWKDVRKSTARAILFFLAIADFFSATGYFVSSVVYFAVNDGTHKRFCGFQSIWIAYFPMTSYFWTANFAVYYFVILVLKKNQWRKKLMFIFHLTSWLIPLAICVPAVATGWLGKGLFTLSGVWCFVSDKNFLNQSVNNFEYLKDMYFFMEVICGKLWEFVTCTTGMTCFVLIITCNRCRWRKVCWIHDYPHAIHA